MSALAYGEPGATSGRVTAQVRAHKRAFREYLGSLVGAAGLPAAPGGQLFLPVEGAMVMTGVTGAPGRPPRRARRPGCFPRAV